MNNQKPSFFAKYKLGIIVAIFSLFLLAYMLYENRDNNKVMAPYALEDLKNQLDTIKKNQENFDKAISIIDVKIDSVKTKTITTKNNITNIYKTEVNEKTKLNKATDSANLIYFTSYIDNWLQSNQTTKQ